MDLAMKANAKLESSHKICNLVIEIKVPKENKINVKPDSLKLHYELGRESALENLPRIKALIN
jgi:hypothetical protein